jgi:membrane protease YdiL (CAAX protease family)
MLASNTHRRYWVLVSGTAIGTWLGLRLQFGLGIAPHLSDELALFGIALLAALILLALLIPLSGLLERYVAAHRVAVVSVGAVLVAVALGLWVYVGFLHRPPGLVLERDWPYVLCFGLGGVGYAVSYALQGRI